MEISNPVYIIARIHQEMQFARLRAVSRGGELLVIASLIIYKKKKKILKSNCISDNLEGVGGWEGSFCIYAAIYIVFLDASET